MIDPIVIEIREARKAAGMKQHAMARAAGMSQATVSQIERGNRRASLPQVRAMAAVLGLEIVLRRRQ